MTLAPGPSANNAACWIGFLANCRFALGDRVRASNRRCKWVGKVVGYFSSRDEPIGVCVEIASGVIPLAQDRLELVKPAMDVPR